MDERIYLRAALVLPIIVLVQASLTFSAIVNKLGLSLYWHVQRLFVALPGVRLTTLKHKGLINATGVLGLVSLSTWWRSNYNHYGLNLNATPSIRGHNDLTI